MRRRGANGPLTLETYRRVFIDPWDTPVSVNNLNRILRMHGFTKLHREPKRRIMRYLVGQVDLLPPRRSTLHRAALSPAAPPSAAVITTAQARGDVEAIGWAECPIGYVAAFTVQAAAAPEPVERVPRPADFVVVGRRPRSKRTRASAYKHTRKRKNSDASHRKVMVTVKEEKRELSPPPPPPPRCMRSPTPPPPPSSPPRPSSAQQLLPRQDVAPRPPTQRGAQPTLAPLPAPPCRGSPALQPSHPPQLYWGLPLPMPDPGTPMSVLPPGWGSPTVPSCYPAPFWGAPCVLPPLSPRVPWDCPPGQPPQIHLPQEPFPSHFPGQQPHPHPAQLGTPPPPLQLHCPPPHFLGQLSLPPPMPHLPGHQPPPAQLQVPPPLLQLRRPPPHFQGQMLPPPHLPGHQPPPAQLQPPSPSPPLQLRRQPPHLQGPPPPPLHLHGPPGFF